MDKSVNLNITNATILRVIMWIVLVVAIVRLQNLVLVMLTSIVIASFIESAVFRFKKYIKNRVFLVVGIYILCGAILSGVFYVFVPVFINELSNLSTELAKYIPDQSILSGFQESNISGAKDVVSTISHKASLEEIINSTKNFVSGFSGGFFSMIVSVFGGIVNLVLIIVISFYLSVKEKGIENFLRIIIPEAHENYAINLWQRTERKIGLWIQGQMLVGIIVGVLIYLGLTIIGVKYALVLAILTAFSELIPFGMILAYLPAVIFGYLDGGIIYALMTTGLYVIVQQFEGYLIYPLIVKKVIGIPPLVVMISIIAGGTLAGFWGIILSIPIAVLLLELLSDIEKKKVLSRNS